MSLRVRRIRNISADLVVGAVLPLAATLVLAGERLVGTAALAVTLLVVAVRWAQERRRLEFRWDVLGQYVGMRALGTACVAATVVGTARRPADVLWAALATLVLGGLLVCEPRLKVQSETTVPVVLNLPGVAPGREKPVSPLAMVVLHAVAVLGGVVVAALSGPAWVWALLSLVPLAYAAWIAVEAARRAEVGRRLMAAAPAAVAAYAPEIVIHTAHAGPNYHQVMMWLPFLQRTGLRVMVLTRFPGPSRALRDRVGDVPLVQAPELTDLDAMMVGSVKAVFYPNAKVGNSSVVRRHPGVRHVFVNHGDSDKSTAYAPSHASYDHIFAAGPAAVRRYAEHGVVIAPEKFMVVGRPQAEGILPERGPVGSLDSVTVLYAPTWKGFTTETSISSVSMGPRIVAALLRTRATVVFRPHPSSYNFVKDRVHIAEIHAMLARDAQETGRRHVFGPAADRDLDSVGCMNLADAMVSDLSAVAVDFLISGKPLAMVAVGAEPEEFVRRFPMSRGDYLVHRDLANIDDVLATMLGDDPMREQRHAVRADYLGDFPVEGYASHFVDAARWAGTTPKPGAVRPATGTATPAKGRAARPLTLRAQLGLVRRSVLGEHAGLRATLQAYAWCVSLVLGVGALAAGLTSARLATAVLVVLTTALLLRVPVRPRRPKTFFRLVEADLVPRACLVVAVLAATTAATGAAPGPALLACGLGAALTSERLVRGWSEQWPVTRNVPGLREGRGEPYPGLLVLLALPAELLVLAVPTPLVTGVVGVVLLLAAVAVALMALARIGNGKAVDAAWRAGLVAYDPRFCVYVGTNANPGDNLRAWLPHLARTGERFAVITHHASSVDEVDRVCRAAGQQVPIVYRPKFRYLERAITPGMNAALYVHNSLLNNQMVTRRDLTHVFLNHREGEGNDSWTPMAAMYDRVFVPGEVAVQRFARHEVHLPEQKFELVGRPQVAAVRPRTSPVDPTAPTVLYTPTWSAKDGSRASSLPAATGLVQALLARGGRVLLRPDAACWRYREARETIAGLRALLDADRAATGREHVVVAKGAGGTAALLELMNTSDALLSDTVTPLYDYLRSDKPFALAEGVTGPEAEAPVLQAAYGLRTAAEQVEVMLDEMLGTDPLAAVRGRLRRGYLGDFVDDGDYAAVFADAVRRVSAVRPASAGGDDAAEEED